MTRKSSSKSIPKLTPLLYFPCRNCGLWRRQHVGKEKKCPFASGCFDPIPPEKLKTNDRQRLNDRIESLRIQLVKRPSDWLQVLDEKIDALETVATSECSHQYDDGTDATDRYESPPGGATRFHVICELCKEDWYL